MRKLWQTARRLAMALVVSSPLVLLSAPNASAGYGGFVVDADDHYVAECGGFWPTANTFATTRNGSDFSATWVLSFTQGQIDSLKCLKSRYALEFVELDFRLFDFTGPDNWDAYSATSDLPGAVHDVAASDAAAKATPGVTEVWVDSLAAGKTYTTRINWSGGLVPISGGSPRISFELVPSYWAKSLAEQVVCGTHGGQPGWCIFGQLRAFVSHGNRGNVSVPFSGSQSYTYPVNLAAYANHLVQWDADTKSQRTEWLVTPDLKRLWVPDTATHSCLSGRGYAGPDLLQAGTLNALPDQTNMWAACGDRLLSNRVLRRNMYLKSNDGRYTLWLQGDGNFVLYGPSGRATWALNRYTTDFVIFQGDGNLVAYTASGGVVWASGTNGRAASMFLVQNDGNLVIYGGQGALWASNTSGRV